MAELVNQGINNPPLDPIEDQAIRAARAARALLTWHDARKALVRGIELLIEWQLEQPPPDAGR